jgi:hypothetical protein
MIGYEGRYELEHDSNSSFLWAEDLEIRLVRHTP